MLHIYLLLLGTVAKGIVATDPTTHAPTNDISGGPLTTSTSSDSTSTPTSNHTDNVFTSSTAITTNSTPSVLFSTTESVMTESTSVIPTTTPSTRLTDTSTTSEAVAGNETDNSSLTTSSPPDFPSTPTNGATTTTTNPENGQTTVTTTGTTVLTTMPTKPTEPVTTSNSTVTTVSPSLTTTATTNTVTTLQTTESTTTAAPLITTVVPPIVCPFKPCPSESLCFQGTCQCISGTYMQDGVCQQVQVFPGQLHLTSRNFSEGMRDRTSEIFKTTAAEITSALKVALQNTPGYLRSDVVQLQPGSVIASVNNNFQNTNATQATVDEIIQNAIINSTGILQDGTFTGTNVCENTPLPCDLSSTTCSVQNGIAVCSCKEGFIPFDSLYSNKNKSCRACPSGERAVGNKCETCAFGYSGFNCNDSALLAVVVISCVLGGVLLLLVLALLIYCCWKCCSKDKPDYESSPYSSGELNQPWPTGITPIPRASTNFDSGAAIEMTEGGSTNNLVDKKHQTNGLTGSYDLNPEDMKTFKGKNTSRYSYLVQGHENPYFLPGDDKKS